MFVFMGTNIIFRNCQGIRPKRKELELYLKENNFDIVALNETFLTKNIYLQIQGYDTIKTDSSTGATGGVAFLVKHGLVDSDTLIRTVKFLKRGKAQAPITYTMRYLG